MRRLFLFDFDGTLTNSDSSKYFYKSISSIFQYFYCYYLIPFIPLIRYFLFRGENFEIKKKRFYGFQRVASSRKFNLFISQSDEYMDHILREKALKCIRKINENPNNDVFIISASLSILLEKWTKREKIGLITNTLVRNQKGQMTFIESFDCDGIGKKLRIKREIILSKYDYIISVGDTPNDFNMFELSDKFYYKSLDIMHEI